MQIPDSFKTAGRSVVENRLVLLLTLTAGAAGAVLLGTLAPRLLYMFLGGLTGVIAWRLVTAIVARTQWPTPQRINPDLVEVRSDVRKSFAAACAMLVLLAVLVAGSIFGGEYFADDAPDPTFVPVPGECRGAPGVEAVCGRYERAPQWYVYSDEDGTYDAVEQNEYDWARPQAYIMIGVLASIVVVFLAGPIYIIVQGNSARRRLDDLARSRQPE